MEEETIKPVELEETKEIDLPRADVTSYIGKKAKIMSADTFEGKYGYLVKVLTEDLGPLLDATGNEIKDANGVVIQARASKIFGLKSDASGKVGWTKDSKLGDFLKKYGVSHFKELVGKEVVVQGQDNEGRTFLTFL